MYSRPKSNIIIFVNRHDGEPSKIGHHLKAKNVNRKKNSWIDKMVLGKLINFES
jgi:hypothetical protein